MKRFVFRLVALERLREVRKRDAGARLARALAESARLERASRELDEAADRSAGGVPEPGRSTDSHAWKNQLAWCEGQRRAAAALREQAVVARDEVQKLADAYESAVRKCRVIERFRDRRHREWRREAGREQTRALAEGHLRRLTGRNGREETSDDA